MIHLETVNYDLITFTRLSKRLFSLTIRTFPVSPSETSGNVIPFVCFVPWPLIKNRSIYRNTDCSQGKSIFAIILSFDFIYARTHILWVVRICSYSVKLIFATNWERKALVVCVFLIVRN